MGEVIQLRRPSAKQAPAEPIALEDDRLVTAVEHKLAEGEWKLRRKQPRDRADLIALARNLTQMYRRLPHGEKARALRASGFGGDNDAAISTYANNLMLPAGAVSSDDRRIRRLSTRVKRYVDVAVAIEGDRRRALSYLFRWTSYDRASSDDWQGKLSARLHRLAIEVAACTDLPRYFDEASAANVCLADDGGTSFRATGWLSETFHKDEFARVGAADIQGGWLYDRTEEGVPKSGAPLFVPKAALDASSRSWMVRRANEAGSETSCTFTSTLHIAIVPLAASLTEPCRVECRLLLRPEVSIQSGRLPVWQVLADGSGTRIRVGDDIFHPVDEAAFRAWSATAEGRLFVEQQDDSRRPQSDLLTGCWWCMPATPSAIGQYLSAARVSGQPVKGVYGAALAAALDDPDEEPGTTDLHAVAADLYPPPGTLALEVAYGMSDLRNRLEAAASEMIGNFRVLQHQVRSASPLSD